jgi:hypothetical protein
MEEKGGNYLSALGNISLLQDILQKKEKDPEFEKLVDEEAKEHPWATREQAEQIVRDHLKKKKKDLDVPQPAPPALVDTKEKVFPTEKEEIKKQPFVQHAKYEVDQPEHDFLPSEIRQKLQEVLDAWRKLAFPTEESSGLLKDEGAQKI